MTQKGFHIGAGVDSGTSVYVHRSHDQELADNLAEGNWGAIVGCRTMGKTSLANNYLKHHVQSETCAFIDVMGEIGTRESWREWIVRFADLLASDLRQNGLNCGSLLGGGESGPDAAGSALARIFSKALAYCPGKLVLFLDEIDFLREGSSEHGGEIIRAFRSVRNRTGRRAELQRLQICTIGLRTLNDLMPGTTGSASATGWQVQVDDFDTEDSATVNTIADGFTVERRKAVELAKAVLTRTHGHPSLTMLFCSGLRASKQENDSTLEKLVEEFVRQQLDRPSDLVKQICDFLTDPAQPLSKRFSALTTYVGILDNREHFLAPDALGADLLKISGLVRLRREKLEVANDILRRCFPKRRIDQLQSEITETQPRQSSITVVPSGLRRLLLINLGGTIGMLMREEGKVAATSLDNWLEYYPDLNKIADVETLQLFNLDSANIGPRHWEDLAKEIFQKRDFGYKGIVIAMGTDTLAHVACALSFALGPMWDPPIVITGAQTTPDVLHGDARHNLYRACRVALTPNLTGIVVCFGHHVFLGTRAQKRDDRDFDGFHSPSYPSLALITDEIQFLREASRRRGVVSPVQPTGSRRKVKAKFADGLITIKQTPGLNPEFYQALLVNHLQKSEPRDGPSKGSPPLRGIVFQTLGAGNVPTQVPGSFIPFIRDATQAGIPVVITSQYAVHPTTHVRYEPGSLPIQAGAIGVLDMTAEAAEVKLRWVLAQNKRRKAEKGSEFVQRIKLAMHKPIADEISAVQSMDPTT
jgi:L-asparaginase